MKVSITQPYIFPYFGYFQLVNAADIFVFGEDVLFVNKGWINRNRILLNNKDHLISFPCFKLNSDALIIDVGIDMSSRAYGKALKTIKHAYNQAPHFKEVIPLIESVFDARFHIISELAVHSVKLISDYLEIKTKFMNTSISFSHSKRLNKSDRIINIVKELGSTHYINPIGGMKLYDKAYFEAQGVTLNFIKPHFSDYKQFENDFVPDLSIIDVLMFNSVTDIKEMLKAYTLI